MGGWVGGLREDGRKLAFTKRKVQNEQLERESERLLRASKESERDS